MFIAAKMEAIRDPVFEYAFSRSVIWMKFVNIDYIDTRILLSQLGFHLIFIGEFKARINSFFNFLAKETKNTIFRIANVIFYKLLHHDKVFTN